MNLAQNITALFTAQMLVCAQDLLTRANTAQQEVNKAKNTSKNHNQKFVAKALLQEAADVVKACLI